LDIKKIIRFVEIDLLQEKSTMERYLFRFSCKWNTGDKLFYIHQVIFFDASGEANRRAGNIS